MSRVIKFRAWDRVNLKMITPSAIIGGQAAITILCDKDDRCLADNYGTSYYSSWDVDRATDYPLMQFTGLKDMNGKEIYYDCEIFKFKFMNTLTETIDLIGIMNFHDEELRAEIDIYNNPDYVCLSYLSNGQMYDFEVIGTKFENPELLKEESK